MLYGGNGGTTFNDYIDIPLKFVNRCTSIKLYWYTAGLSMIQFVYSTNLSSSNHGYSGGETNATFYLQSNEEINQINVFTGAFSLIPTFCNSTCVIGIQFSTTLGQTTKVYGTSDGQMNTEPSQQGYTLGYVRGRSGALIDMLQFVWYK
jgi:hypothetical protein